MVVKQQRRQSVRESQTPAEARVASVPDEGAAAQDPTWTRPETYHLFSEGDPARVLHKPEAFFAKEAPDTLEDSPADRSLDSPEACTGQHAAETACDSATRGLRERIARDRQDFAFYARDDEQEDSEDVAEEQAGDGTGDVEQASRAEQSGDELQTGSCDSASAAFSESDLASASMGEVRCPAGDLKDMSGRAIAADGAETEEAEESRMLSGRFWKLFVLAAALFGVLVAGWAVWSGSRAGSSAAWFGSSAGLSSRALSDASSAGPTPADGALVLTGPDLHAASPRSAADEERTAVSPASARQAAGDVEGVLETLSRHDRNRADMTAGKDESAAGVEDARTDVRPDLIPVGRHAGDTEDDGSTARASHPAEAGHLVPAGLVSGKQPGPDTLPDALSLRGSVTSLTNSMEALTIEVRRLREELAAVRSGGAAKSLSASSVDGASQDAGRVDKTPHAVSAGKAVTKKPAARHSARDTRTPSGRRDTARVQDTPRALVGWSLLGLSSSRAVLRDPGGQIWNMGAGERSDAFQVVRVDAGHGLLHTSAGTLSLSAGTAQ